MMKKPSGRAAMLMLASIGALAAPAPAVSQYDPLVQCYLDCRQAYVVNSNQPAKYQLCQNWCAANYEPSGAAPADTTLDVARFD
jgi:hypothetical protein